MGLLDRLLEQNWKVINNCITTANPIEADRSALLSPNVFRYLRELVDSLLHEL